jgi:predicted AAA+ superfamily ATPase
LINRDIGDILLIINRYAGEDMLRDEKILEILNSYNRFWATGQVDAGIPRDLIGRCARQLETKEALLLKGVRRSGKSTLMAQLIRFLLEQGKEPARILRVNLEEPLFAAEYSNALLERIYRIYREHVAPPGRCYLFLDEIQNVDGWEKWVRARGETEPVKMVITGSSSRLLSRETGTKLTGRHVSFEVFPLSFAEFLRFKDVNLTSRADYYRLRDRVRNLFLEYVRFGGFPEVVLRQDDEDKLLLLKQYFEDIIQRDIVARQDIRDGLTLQNLALYLLTNIGRLTSVSSLKKNFGVSQDKIEHYTSALLESCLLHRVAKFDFSVKRIVRARFKPYCIDTGIRNRAAFSFSGDQGWLAENVALNHLRGLHEEIYYGANGAEVDFIVKEGMRISKRIQVWYADAADAALPARETLAFEQPGKDGEGVESLILTNDLDQTLKVGGREVRCMPLVMYLLDLP